MTDRPILAPLAAELKSAVRRRRRRRFLARAAAALVAFGIFGSGTAGALALTGVWGATEPSRPYGVQPPEPNLRYAKKPVVLARGERGHGKSFEVVGYQLAPRDGSWPADVCLDILLLPEGTGHGCLSPTGYWQASSGLPSRGYTIEGAAEVDVSAVRLTFRRADGTPGSTVARLARADNPETLRAVGITEAFAIWRGRVPAGARDVRAHAYGPTGTPTWTAVDPMEVADPGSREGGHASK